ncbi:MAG TPA: hypothetical protein VI318_15325 [Baekduia sp.]
MSVAAVATGAPLALADDLGSAKPADVLAKAKTALAQVKSLHVAGTELDKGDKAPTKIAGTFTSSGPADFTISGGKASARLIALPSALYIKANESYWKSVGDKSSRAIAAKLAGKWIKMPASSGEDATSGLADLSPKHLASCLDSHVGTLSNKGVRTVGGGQKVVVLADAGDKPGTAPGQLWIDERTGLPVREVQSGPAKAGGKKDSACDDEWPPVTQKSDATLSRFGKTAKITAPKGAVSPKQAVGGGSGSGGSNPV